MNSFNGAAPVGARKAKAVVPHHRLHFLLQRGRARGGAEGRLPQFLLDCVGDGFNGAAPVGARKEPSSHSSTSSGGASTGPRPWGRGRPPPSNTFRWCTPLQRGRARGGAEGPGPTESPWHPQWLQRGRARGGAEGRKTSCRPGHGAQSFNGAAPVGARKVNWNWGGIGPCSRASTGPRPWGRGRCLSVTPSGARPQ